MQRVVPALALGRALISAEPVVLISLPKRSNGRPSNVTVRGSSDLGLHLRPGVTIVEGRMFRPGTSEIVVGRATAEGFAGVELGSSLHFAGRDWLIVGRFDAHRSGFDSELWVDAEQMLQVLGDCPALANTAEAYAPRPAMRPLSAARASSVPYTRALRW